MDTERGTSHNGACLEVGAKEWIALGETPNVDDKVRMDAANHHGMCIPM